VFREHVKMSGDHGTNEPFGRESASHQRDDDCHHPLIMSDLPANFFIGVVMQLVNLVKDPSQATMAYSESQWPPNKSEYSPAFPSFPFLSDCSHISPHLADAYRVPRI